MKALTVTLALLLSSLVSAHAVTVSQQATNYFNDADGNAGFVFVERLTDPVTRVTTTDLSYSFCVQTTAASCLEGHGNIPNNAFTGHLDGDNSKPQVVRVEVDTNTPGFVNLLCSGPIDLGGCANGESPATGGLIFLAYITKPGSIEVLDLTDKRLENWKITINSLDRYKIGPASVRGSIFGLAVSNKGATWTARMLSGKGSLAAQHAAAQLSLEKSMTPQSQARLQKLTGEKPIQ